ncbi:MAG TPA: hypothetical protein VNI36_00095 [Candidatus Dormibacteraeota bacterium]|nr:hypothetical protein [Candidatus Dormibacteraeota bacterium]
MHVFSRSLPGSIGAGSQTIAGENITLLSDLCGKTRKETFELMMQRAVEVLACGTAALVERAS